MFKKFRFPPGSILPDPLLFKYYAQKSNFTPLKCKNIKSYELKRIIAKKNNLSYHNKKNGMSLAVDGI